MAAGTTEAMKAKWETSTLGTWEGVYVGREKAESNSRYLSAMNKRGAGGARQTYMFGIYRRRGGGSRRTWPRGGMYTTPIPQPPQRKLELLLYKKACASLHPGGWSKQF